MSHESKPSTEHGIFPENDTFCPYCMSHVAPGESCPTCGLTQGAYSPAPHHLPPGIILAKRYLVGRVLGEGGFGITYIGCDLRLEVKVAIKEYFPRDWASRYADSSLTVSTRTGKGDRSYDQGLKKFLYEARVMARMEKHPQVVTVRDFFEANNTAYIVMEYVEGTDFKELVKQHGGSIPTQELLRIIEPLFAGLSAVHEAGLIHRDISPDNLMLERGAVRLLDFGCARESSHGSGNLTEETMSIMLKPGYSPLEQYQRSGQGPWTDVYALSAVIYYCLTGRVPPQALDRIMDDDLVPPRQLGVDMTAGQEKALLHGLCTLPRKRYQSVTELYAGLYQPVEPEDPPAPPPPPPPLPGPYDDWIKKKEAEEKREEEERKKKKEEEEKPKKVWPYVALGACLVAVLVGLAVAIIGSSSREVPQSGPIGQEISWDNATVVTSPEELQAALASPSVDTISIWNTVFWPTEWGQLELTKPVYIQSNSSLDTFQAVLVGDGGYVEVADQGAMYVNNGLLRTEGSGSVAVRSGGVVSAWGAVLQEKNDLQTEDGGDINIHGQSTLDTSMAEFEWCYVIPAEEDLFANAVAVTTVDELQQALDNPATRSVTISQGSELVLHHTVATEVPLRLEEGASITAAEDAEDGPCLYLGEGSMFLNYGRCTALVANDRSAVVNHGSLGGSIHYDGQGAFLNLGRIEQVHHFAAKYVSFYNLGEMAVVAQDQEPTFADFRENLVLNYGTITLAGRQDNEVWGSSNGRFINSGTLDFGQHSSFGNYGFIENFYNMTLTGGTVDNLGQILSWQELSGISATADSALHGDGCIFYNRPNMLDLGSATVENTLINAAEQGNVAYVTDETSLRAALEQPNVDKVFVDWGAESLTISGDLTVTKPLVCYVRLHVNGTLTLSGQDAMLLMDGGDVSGSKLVVTDGAKMAAIQGLHFSEVTVEDGGYLNFSAFGEEHIIDYALNIGRTGTVVVLDYLNMENASLRIESLGRLAAAGDLYLNDSRVTIENGGELWVEMGELFHSGTLVNRGHLFYCDTHEVHTFLLNGTAENYGVMEVEATSLHVEGDLYNEGEVRTNMDILLNGTLDNRGKIIFTEGEDGPGEVLTEIGGRFSGNQPQQIS